MKKHLFILLFLLHSFHAFLQESSFFIRKTSISYVFGYGLEEQTEANFIEKSIENENIVIVFNCWQN